MLTSVCFFVFGLLCTGLNFMLFATVQDILAGTGLPTATLLASMSIPSCICFIIAPYFVTNIPYIYRIFLINIAIVIAYSLIAFADETVWKLFGVSLEAMCYVLGQATFIGLASLMGDQTVLSIYLIGCSCGMLSSFIYYTSFTTWLCVPPSLTLIGVAPLSILYPVGYYVITRISNRNITDKNGYHLLQSEAIKTRKLNNKDKFAVIWKLFTNAAVPQFIAYVAKYSSQQSLITTIVFPNSPFPSRDSYLYYFLSLIVGELIGRSTKLIISSLCPCLVYNVTQIELWFLAVIQVSHMMVFISESWFRYLPDILPFIVLCFTSGLCAGLFFHDSYEYLSISLFTDEEREFGMGYAMTIMDIGTMVASFVGLYIEPKLKQHCITTLAMSSSSLCLTRASSYQEIIHQCHLKHNASLARM